MTGPAPMRNSAAWWETAVLAGACAVLAFLLGPADARLAGALPAVAALLCGVEALQVHHGGRVHRRVRGLPGLLPAGRRARDPDTPAADHDPTAAQAGSGRS